MQSSRFSTTGGCFKPKQQVPPPANAAPPTAGGGGWGNSSNPQRNSSNGGFATTGTWLLGAFRTQGAFGSLRGGFGTSSQHGPSNSPPHNTIDCATSNEGDSSSVPACPTQEHHGAATKDAGKYFQRGRREREEGPASGFGWRRGDAPPSKRARKERAPEDEADARVLERGAGKRITANDSGIHEDAPTPKRARRSRYYDATSNGACGDLDGQDEIRLNLESSSMQRCGKSSSSELTLSPTFDDDRASQAFDLYARGGDIIAEDGLRQMAKDMGWPHLNASFIVWFWAVDRQTPRAERSMVKIQRRFWMETMAHMGVSHVRDAMPTLTEELRVAYAQRSPEFTSYFKTVFAFLLISDRAFPHRDFARTMDKDQTIRALQRVLGHLSPFTATFCAFLQSRGSVKAVNMDQWSSFLTFSWLITFPSVQGYSTKACWPVLLDDYVDWGVNNCLLGARPSSAPSSRTGSPNYELNSPVGDDSAPSFVDNEFQNLTIASQGDLSPQPQLQVHCRSEVEETGSSSCGEPVLGSEDREEGEGVAVRPSTDFFTTRFTSTGTTTTTTTTVNDGGGRHRGGFGGGSSSRWSPAAQHNTQRPLGGSALMCHQAYSAVGSTRRNTQEEEDGQMSSPYEEDEDAPPSCANNDIW